MRNSHFCGFFFCLPAIRHADPPWFLFIESANQRIIRISKLVQNEFTNPTKTFINVTRHLKLLDKEGDAILVYFKNKYRNVKTFLLNEIKLNWELMKTCTSSTIFENGRLREKDFGKVVFCLSVTDPNMRIVKCSWTKNGCPTPQPASRWLELSLVCFSVEEKLERHDRLFRKWGRPQQ